MNHVGWFYSMSPLVLFNAEASLFIGKQLYGFK